LFRLSSESRAILEEDEQDVNREDEEVGRNFLSYLDLGCLRHPRCTSPLLSTGQERKDV